MNYISYNFTNQSRLCSNDGLGPLQRKHPIFSSLNPSPSQPVDLPLNTYQCAKHSHLFLIKCNVSVLIWCYYFCWGLNKLLWSRMKYCGRNRTLLLSSQIMACCQTAPSHFLEQWWFIVSWTLGDKLMGGINRSVLVMFSVLIRCWAPFDKAGLTQW